MGFNYRNGTYTTTISMKEFEVLKDIFFDIDPKCIPYDKVDAIESLQKQFSFHNYKTLVNGWKELNLGIEEDE